MRNRFTRRFFLVCVGVLFVGAFISGIFSGLHSNKHRVVNLFIQFGIAVRHGDVGEQLRDVRKQTGCQVSMLAMDYTWDDDFPYDAVQFVSKKGATPILRWAPQFTEAFDEFSFKTIMDGTWDEHITRWADRARQSEYPIAIALFADVNREDVGVEDLESKSEEYRQAFQYVVDKFREKKATNVVWIWQISDDEAMVSLNAMQRFYPGDKYVDWIGLSFAYTPVDSLRHNFINVNERSVPTSNTKPVMLTIADVNSFPEQMVWLNDGLSFALTSSNAKALVIDVATAFPFKDVKKAFLSLPKNNP